MMMVEWCNDTKTLCSAVSASHSKEVVEISSAPDFFRERRATSIQQPIILQDDDVECICHPSIHLASKQLIIIP